MEEKLVNGMNNHGNGNARPQYFSNGHKDTHSCTPQKDTCEEDDYYVGEFEKCSFVTLALTKLGLYLLMLFGFINQLLFVPEVATEKNREGYAPLYDQSHLLFLHYVYRRVKHSFNRPICSVPGAEFTLKERVSSDYNWTFQYSGRLRRCINLGSFDYLGFAETEGVGATAAADAAKRYGLALASPRAELGTSALHVELERTMAQFLGVEAAAVFGMGFAANSLGLPALVGPDALVLSDEKNHASLILGLRMARVAVRVFRHNDVRHLERLARHALAERRWRRIVVVVEGVYSMEGSIVPLRAIVTLKKSLGFSIYIDEAHSMGGLGSRGRGVTDYWGIDPNDIDVLMGSFAKSFGAAGGYIAGSRSMVDRILSCGYAHPYAHAMAPPVCAQALAALRAVDTPTGLARIRTLRNNTQYFRTRLQEMGVVTYGHRDSPVVPLLVYSVSKMSAAVERLTALGVATVGVGFPATPLYQARLRICLSAAHSREQLERSIAAIQVVVSELGLAYSRRKPLTIAASP